MARRAAISDVVAIKQARLQRMMELSHDLRHPLSVILLWEQIARLTDSVAMRAKALDAIHQAALEQLTTVDELVRRTR